MQWINKGHEFDEIGKRFENLERIYIYGAGQFGMEVATLLKGIGANFIFIDQIKAEKKKYMGVDIIYPEQIERNKIDSIIVLAMGQVNSGLVLKQLELKGYRLGADIFDIYSFMNFYIYIIALYRFNKCIMRDCSVMATYNCSLRCKNCIGAFPYMKEPKKVEFEDWKKDVDILFENVDFIVEFGIAGGEMLLVKDLEKYIEYVMDNYRQQISNCTFLTNGTILPNVKVIEALKKYNMHVVVSNYSNLIHWDEKYQKLEALMKENNIPISTIEHSCWVDMGWKYNNYSEEANKLFDMCGMQCRVVRDGKLNFCVHGMTANDALFQFDLTEDEFDLKKSVNRKKYLIVEYHLGFNDKGEMKMCHFCNGDININGKTVAVAEQIGESV